MIDRIRIDDSEDIQEADTGDFLTLRRIFDEGGAAAASGYVRGFDPEKDAVFIRRAHTMIWALQNVRLAPVYDANAERKMKIL